MAETANVTRAAAPTRGWRSDAAAYRAVIRSRVDSQRSYTANFRIDLLSSVLIGLVELAEVWVLFHNVQRIGGLEFAQILLVFGLADLSFSMADLSFGHCDNLPTYVRQGTLDVFYLRPQPLLMQLITSDISLRRLARGTVGVVSITAALAMNDIDWGVRTVALLATSLVSGYAVFCAQFVSAGGLQFFLIDGAEMTNAYVYGGRYAATQPAAVWNRPLKLVFGFFFPMAFTAYLPVVTLLRLPGTSWMPGWLGWCAPIAAVWSWLFAAFAWRIGVRHYQGGGG